MREYKIQLDETAATIYERLSAKMQKHPEEFFSEMLHNEAAKYLQFFKENKDPRLKFFSDIINGL